MTPLISLIITARNSEHVLPRMLDSVIAQHADSLEVLVVDDCSEHSPCDIIESYAAKGLDIHLIRSEKRLWTKNARIHGVLHSHGNIIAFADADDVLLNEGSLEYHAKLMHQKNVDIFAFKCTALNEFGETKKSIRSFLCPPDSILVGNDIFTQYVMRRLKHPLLWQKFYSRRLWEKILPMARASAIRRHSEDVFLSILLFFHAESYTSSHDVGYGYYEQVKTERFAGRAASLYLIGVELLPYLRQHGCPEIDIERFIYAIKYRLHIYAGKYVRSLEEKDGFDLSIATLERDLDGDSKDCFLKAMLLGNRINANKLVECVKIIYPGVPNG
ncbi:glycosyltransferase family 2 protein [Desulfovibrio sp. OttesenSCG-928-F20]|nr:glycosyltransferase family 2 protein [Desulfovibrio sp. OttesenSCG-928-M16]MDL2291238.1 glycosyltransferase family 2 protein [Desulfovibrio sp. OttesenSCG-928-F20]